MKSDCGHAEDLKCCEVQPEQVLQCIAVGVLAKSQIQ